jgi:hypothetical protein
MFSLSPLIAKVKGNIRGVSPGVSDQHLPRYRAEFCCRFNRRVLKSQMFNRMITAGLKAQTVTFWELRRGAHNFFYRIRINRNTETLGLLNILASPGDFTFIPVGYGPVVITAVRHAN